MSFTAESSGAGREVDRADSQAFLSQDRFLAEEHVVGRASRGEGHRPGWALQAPLGEPCEPGMLLGHRADEHRKRCCLSASQLVQTRVQGLEEQACLVLSAA